LLLGLASKLPAAPSPDPPRHAQATVTFGRIGTSGQREIKTFADAAAAEKHGEKKMREKLAKGYHEIA
jgi:predicted DNA-binding WGR domain protein